MTVLPSHIKHYAVNNMDGLGYLVVGPGFENGLRPISANTENDAVLLALRLELAFVSGRRSMSEEIKTMLAEMRK